MGGLAVLRRRPEHGGPTVVLAHGAMDRGASFGRTMRRLGEVDVIAYDRRGYAGSIDAGVAETITEHARDLVRIAGWSGTNDIVLIGHSLGGLIAAKAAATLASLGSLRSVGAFEAPMYRPERDDGSAGSRALAAGQREGPGAAARSFMVSMLGEATWRRLRENDRVLRMTEGPALMAELTDLRRPGSALAVGDGKPPVHCAMGEMSPRRMRDSAELMAQITGGTLRELPGSGHGVHLSHPDEFAHWILTVVLNGADPAI